MTWVSNVGYAAFPLPDGGKEIASFQETMHIVVTVLVVVLSVASLVCLIVNGYRDRRTKGLGICAAIALAMMLVGAFGQGIVDPRYFGVVERFSVFSAVGFNAVLGINLSYASREWEVSSMDNMTALVATFARAYHYRYACDPVFADDLAEQMLTAEEYDAISKNMSDGISFFAPDFTGGPEEALRFVVDHQLAPSVLARSAFAERAIDNAIRIGCGQCVLYACGYDTFSLRTGHAALSVFELDRPEVIRDRKARITRSGLQAVCSVTPLGCDLADPSWKDHLIDAGFDVSKQSFGSLLGISYYLSREDFESLIRSISSISRKGSSICFDYPLLEAGTESLRNRQLAAAAGEPMRARYAYRDMERLLAASDFLIFEHLSAAQATHEFFCRHNSRNPGHHMSAPAGVSYCLAVKQ